MDSNKLKYHNQPELLTKELKNIRKRMIAINTLMPYMEFSILQSNRLYTLLFKDIINSLVLESSIDSDYWIKHPILSNINMVDLTYISISEIDRTTKIIKSFYDKYNNPDHKLKQNLYYIDSCKEVRIIQNKQVH